MVWITILIDIIKLLPTLMPIIIEIWDAITGQPIAEHKFGTLLLKYHENHGLTATAEGLASAQAEFEAFRAAHVGASAGT